MLRTLKVGSAIFIGDDSTVVITKIDSDGKYVKVWAESKSQHIRFGFAAMLGVAIWGYSKWPTL